MKNSLKSILLALTVVFAAFACQQEEIIINNRDGQTLDSMSPLADLVSQTTMHDGSADNIIDQSSCLTVVLPVTVIANGTELVIASPEDYVLIERIFDESPDDQDVLEIVYPINVKLPDHSIEDISSAAELAEVTEDCLEGGEDLDIECLDFKYPVLVSVYSSGTQVAKVAEIANDEQMNTFLSSLDETTVFSFNFPITMIFSDSSEVVVNSNEELEALIDEVDDSCDEDDDFDYDDDDIDTSDLEAIIQSTAWVVTYLFTDADYTSEFNGMIFTFREDDDLANVLVENYLITGSWEVYGDDGALEIEFEFENEATLALLEEEYWSVSFYDSTKLELNYLTEGGSYASLVFEATEQTGEPGPTVADYIINGEWLIASFIDDGQDFTQDYTGYRIAFTLENKLTFTNDVENLEGEWTELVTADGHWIILDFGSPNAEFEKIEKEWQVVSYVESSVVLSYVDPDTEAVFSLVLEKL